jgi:hypothetical protein
MSHDVKGIIANAGLCEAFARKHLLRPPVPLPDGLAMIPLRDLDLDTFLGHPLTGRRTGFVYLFDQLTAALMDISAQGTVMYFETAYFGGIGTQAAFVLNEGNIVLARADRIGPLNEGLAHLGVKVRPPAKDEFDTVGIGRHRTTAEWLGVGEVDEDA